MNDINEVIDAANNCIQALKGLRSEAITIVDMGQEQLGADAFQEAQKKLDDNLLGEIREDVVAALLAARLKHMGVLGVGCCGVLKATACETAMELAVQVSLLMTEVPDGGVSGNSYVKCCADAIRSLNLNKTELDHLMREVNVEKGWIPGQCPDDLV